MRKDFNPKYAAPWGGRFAAKDSLVKRYTEKHNGCGGIVRVVDHGKWEGWFCTRCKLGGSRQKKNNLW